MTERRAGAGLLRGAAAMAVAMGLMNLANYVYTVVAARLLGPVDFGAFSALMGVMIVLSVLSLGLQATGARRISSDPEHVNAIERVVLGVTYRGALVLGVVCLALAPLFDAVLRLDSLPTALLVSTAVVPVTIMGGQAGVLQGEQRWTPLALVYLSQGLGRFAVGIGLILVWPSEFSAFLGVAIGAWVPVLIGSLALRRPRRPAPAVTGAGAALLHEVGSSSQALLAFFALSNADILLARAVLDSGEAGLYAGGLILVKAILFLPQFVVVIAFPSMARNGSSRGTLVKSLGIAGGLGLIALVGVVVLPDLAQVFVGGSDFLGVKDSLWRFAIVGTLLSMIQVLVYSALARQHWLSIAMIWTTLVALVALSSTVDSATSLVALVAVVDGVLFVGLIAFAFLRRPATREVEALEQQRV
ncbi:MAG: oligosaccharide flippase family protein [Nocardioides sp.]|nr:oligosaccharide flippase family protein [Nocardioides sp.]